MTNAKWTLTFNTKAEKKLKKLPNHVQERIINFFEERVLVVKDPTVHASPLVGTHQGLWRFRIGDYRVIATINNHEVIIVAIDVGHRKEVYEIY